MNYSINDNFHTLAGYIKDGTANQVILITGQPRTGKTTLAHRLSTDIQKNTDMVVEVISDEAFLGLDWVGIHKKVRDLTDKNRLAGRATIMVVRSRGEGRPAFNNVPLEQASFAIECVPGFDFRVVKCRDSDTLFRIHRYDPFEKADLGIEQSC